jgi:protein-disulfide isomerase
VLTVEPKLIEQYVKTNKVKIVFRDVLNHGDRSLRTSEAAACAGKQGLFWQMHEILFERQSEVWGTSGQDATIALMNTYGKQVPTMDSNALNACLRDNATLKQLQAADAEQRTRGITSQPIFEITGKGTTRRIVGKQSFEVFSAAIDALLK